MIQLKSLYPNLFLFGSAGIVNADSSILGWLGSWVSYMLLCQAVAPMNLNLSELFIEHKTPEFEDEIQTICMCTDELRYFMFIELFTQKLTLNVVFIFPSFIYTNVFIQSALLKSSNNSCLKSCVIN